MSDFVGIQNCWPFAMCRLNLLSMIKNRQSVSDQLRADYVERSRQAFCPNEIDDSSRNTSMCVTVAIMSSGVFQAKDKWWWN